MMRRILAIGFLKTVVTAGVLTGCTVLVRDVETLYGPASPRNRTLTPAQLASGEFVSFRKQVQPILQNRCVVCHSCYDAPCQMLLSSIEGIDRGASEVPVYNGARFLVQEPTRLGIDARTTAGWREKGFHPILNERDQSPVANLENSLLYRMLLLKRGDDFPGAGRLPEEYDVPGGDPWSGRDATSHAQQCPTIERFDRFATRHPKWGMPFAFPPLSESEFNTLETWLRQGARAEPLPDLPPPLMVAMDKWEAFLNGSSNKERLMSRYLYEHLFLGHLFFGDIDRDTFFMLVRSRTPPGEPLDVIATVRPYDDPGTDVFYYRLQRFDQMRVDKTHMPYALDGARMARYRELFLDADYVVDELPTYDPVTSANPFKTFDAIPPKNRYQFMLDEAHFIISGFIKGPVCRGAIALSVIDDHFWVVFADPETNLISRDADYLRAVSDYLRIPSEQKSDISLLEAWRAYHDVARDYFLAKVAYYDAHYPDAKGWGLEQIWNGEQRNDNAALTVYRHHDSATVVKGFVGEVPKSAWVLDYPILERIHYLLVAGFNVYGTAGHQLASRTYMDFLRMEAEFNFLTLLPRSKRLDVYRHWYRGSREPEKLERFLEERGGQKHEPQITYESEDTKKELFLKIARRIGAGKTYLDTINLCRELPVECAAIQLDPASALIEEQMRRLSNIGGEITNVFPETMMVRVLIDGSLDNDRAYTFLHNKSYLNTTSLVPSEKSRVMQEDTLDVIRGFVGAYPNFFLQVPLDRLEDFVDTYLAVNDAESYHALMEVYGVRRSHADFWQISDWFYQKHLRVDPLYAGVFDLNRYQNR